VARLISRDEEAETWWTLSGLYESWTVSESPGALHVGRYQRTLNPGDSTALDSAAHSYDGAAGTTAADLGVRRLYHVGARFDFGFGLGVGFSQNTDSLLDASHQTEVVTYDDGDSTPTRADYVTTVTSAESWLRRTTGLRATFTLPVGLEFRVVPPVALRLGALASLFWDDATTTSQLLSFAPRKTRTVYGDGSFAESVEEVQRSPSGSETRQALSQTVDLTYGAGFRPVENLQIDLMGFANLTNLVNWRLSATLRF
jgi:hypothetical protein